MVVLTLQAKAPGQSMLVISQGGARDPGMQAIPVAGATAVSHRYSSAYVLTGREGSEAFEERLFVRFE